MTVDAFRDAEDKLDETIEETFPASDAPANTIVTGSLVSIVEADGFEVRDNAVDGRLEIAVHDERRSEVTDLPS